MIKEEYSSTQKNKFVFNGKLITLLQVFNLKVNELKLSKTKKNHFSNCTSSIANSHRHMWLVIMGSDSTALEGELHGS